MPPPPGARGLRAGCPGGSCPVAPVKTNFTSIFDLRGSSRGRAREPGEKLSGREEAEAPALLPSARPIRPFRLPSPDYWTRENCQRKRKASTRKPTRAAPHPGSPTAVCPAPPGGGAPRMEGVKRLWDRVGRAVGRKRARQDPDAEEEEEDEEDEGWGTAGDLGWGAVGGAVVVKLGGAELTEKDLEETIDMHSALRNLSIIASAWLHGSMRGRLVVVHGAGSFGHFEARRAGLQRGDLDREGVRRGFCKTRIQVTELNQNIIKILEALGVPAVACPVLPGWKTKGKKVQAERSDVGMIEDLMAAGFLPVVHGDAVLDDEQGCAILSGDAIAQRLCEALPRVHSCVFVTNVWGVFDRPPSARLVDHPLQWYEAAKRGGAGLPKLIRFVGVQATGSGDATTLHFPGELSTAVGDGVADVTGGIEGKIKEAAAIAAAGAPVAIVKGGTNACICAVAGHIDDINLSVYPWPDPPVSAEDVMQDVMRKEVCASTTGVDRLWLLSQSGPDGILLPAVACGTVIRRVRSAAEADRATKKMLNYENEHGLAPYLPHALHALKVVRRCRDGTVDQVIYDAHGSPRGDPPVFPDFGPGRMGYGEGGRPLPFIEAVGGAQKARERIRLDAQHNQINNNLHTVYGKAV